MWSLENFAEHFLIEVKPNYHFRLPDYSGNEILLRPKKVLFYSIVHKIDSFSMSSWYKAYHSLNSKW